MASVAVAVIGASRRHVEGWIERLGMIGKRRGSGERKNGTRGQIASGRQPRSMEVAHRFRILLRIAIAMAIHYGNRALL